MWGPRCGSDVNTSVQRMVISPYFCIACGQLPQNSLGIVQQVGDKQKACLSVGAGPKKFLFAWGAPLEGVRKNPPPPPCSPLFACLPKPHPLVFENWFRANHHMFTPLLVADFHFCPKWSIFPDFSQPPFLLEGGF